jgi:PAS domain S-box-containing protein
LITIDSTGGIVMVNSQTERLFAYCRQELVDQPIELLIPERLRSVHVEDRASYVEQPRVWAMGHANLQLVAQPQGRSGVSG